MKRLLIVICALGVGLLPTLAHAATGPKTGRCVLQVKGKSYLNGPCEISREPDGSFSIGVGQKHRSRYFAYVNMDEDGAHGYWNETPDASHAHSDLGLLKRDGACWKNDTARICAYK